VFGRPADKCGYEVKTVAYSMDVPTEALAVNLVLSLIGRHPLGVTFNEFMHSYSAQISSHIVVLLAIDLLLAQGKVYTNPAWRTVGYLQNVKLFATPLTA
jgi:hypothetical protein